MIYYALEGKKVVPIGDINKYIEYIKGRDSPCTTIRHNFVRGTRISTIFMFIDHNWNLTENHLPLVFETMIFNHPVMEGYQERYYTYDQAVAGHHRAVREVINYLRDIKNGQTP